MKVKKSLLNYIHPKASVEERIAVVSGEVDLPTEDLVTLLYMLTFDKEAVVVAAARKAIAECPENTLMNALARELPSEVISFIVEKHRLNDKLLDMVILNPNTSDETLEKLATLGSFSVMEMLIASSKILVKPSVLAALKNNPHVTQEVVVIVDRLLHTLEEKYRSEANEGHKVGHVASSARDLPKALIEEHKNTAVSDNVNLYRMLRDMTVGEKIKLAFTGNKEARSLLLKQTNKVVSRSVIRNPRITEDEIIRITQMRSVSDEILREISKNEEWVKNYQVRKGLVFNSKTPIPISLHFVSKIYEKDLRALAKAKSVPNVVAAAARRIIERRK